MEKETSAETKVVNLRFEAYDVYIGRPGKGFDGFFGNPHPIGFCSICKKAHNRDEAIDAFKKDFLIRIQHDDEYKKKIIGLKGKKLGCFCSPARCHGDIIKEWIEMNQL
jgi:hypothetical protein